MSGTNAADAGRAPLPGPTFGVAWGFLYGTGGVKAETFMPRLRELGGWTKVYLFWGQIEPEKGRYDWTAVDAFLNQLHSPEEGLISLFCSSPWATRGQTAFLPPSPAKDPEDYARFVRALVGHCKGRVRYWQNDCEPNNPVYWSGTAAEFVAQLKLFHKAVKEADPAAVVLAGGYDGVFNPPPLPPIPNQDKGLAFFDTVLKDGRDAFDVFDLRMYVSPYVIPTQVAYFRKKMADLGYQRPIVCTEYHGPGFFGFKENRQYFGLIAEWSAAVAAGRADKPLAEAAGKNPIAALYEKMPTLAPQTQMFMAGCPKQLDDKFRRLQARDLVARNVLALSAGVQKTLFWDLWHDTTQRDDLMHLMYSKFKLLEYEDGVLKRRYPTADAFQRMTTALGGVEHVRRVETPGRPTIYLFEAERRGRKPVHVVWEQRDTFTGEDAPAVAVDWPWAVPGAKALDALGHAVPTKVEGGRVSLAVTDTPVFVEPSE